MKLEFICLKNLIIFQGKSLFQKSRVRWIKVGDRNPNVSYLLREAGYKQQLQLPSTLWLLSNYFWGRIFRKKSCCGSCCNDHDLTSEVLWFPPICLSLRMKIVWTGQVRLLGRTFVKYAIQHSVLCFLNIFLDRNRDTKITCSQAEEHSSQLSCHLLLFHLDLKLMRTFETIWSDTIKQVFSGWCCYIKQGLH